MKRPSENDDGIIRETAEQLYKRLVENKTIVADESYIDHLYEALDTMAWNGDGYDLAKELDDTHNWEIDEDLVSELGGFSSIQSRVHREWVAKWVAACNITTDFKVGDLVEYKDPVKGLFIGEIIKLDEKYAQALVFVEGLKHVRTGFGIHGVVINYEKLIPYHPPKEAA